MSVALVLANLVLSMVKAHGWMPLPGAVVCLHAALHTFPIVLAVVGWIIIWQLRG